MLQPRYVDLGDFGVTRYQAGETPPFPHRTPPVWPVRPYPYSRYLGGVSSLLREFQPEVVYLAGEPSELSVAQIVRLARRDCPAARLLAYSFENVDRHWQASFPRSLRGRAERYCLSQLDLIAVASTSARRRLEGLGYAPERLRLLPLGTDAIPPAGVDSAPLRDELGLTPDTFLVGYLGRLVYEKGIDLLLEALAQLPPQVTLALAGSGDYEPQLRALANRLGVEQRVRWLGRLPRERVPVFLAACDTLVLPSRGIPVWQEQFGMVLVEAMLSGTPVVGSSSGAIPEVAGEGGLIFPEGEAGALAAQLRRLADDPALRQTLAEQGRARAYREYTQEVYLRRLTDLFAEVAKLPLRG